jgi:polyhydroxyalkanoate synthesis regulator phasin
MFETLDKMMLATIGAMSMTRDRAERLFDDYVARGQAESGRKEGFVNDLMKSAERTRSELEQMIGRQVRETAERMEIPTKEDIRRLEAKLDRIEAALSRGETTSSPGS